MIITVASGKGGTGKTTVAVGLAEALADVLPPESNLWLLDCDVEEPNAHLFLRPKLTHREDVALLVPQIDLNRCTFCGRCAEVCAFHAIAVVGQKVLVFHELCHSCGSCMLNCPAQAILEVPRTIGIIQEGRAGWIRFAHGVLNVGEAMASPLIRQLRVRLSHGQSEVAILDAPPGTACPVVSSLRGADVALMVTEPTPFGLHDLQVAVEVARGGLGLPVGVVVNRDGVGDAGVDAYCEAENIPILMRIPLDRRIAEAYSNGHSLMRAVPELRRSFIDLYARLQAMAQEKTL